MSSEGISIVSHTICEGIRVENTDGCLVPTTSTCGGNDKFSEMSGSMPDPIVVSGSIRVSPGYCEIMCRANCSCIAYSSFRDDRTGCELYYGDIRYLRHIINKGNDFTYVRGIFLQNPIRLACMIDMGAPLNVPVSGATLGQIFNMLGEPV
ncbi:hypothetical protein LguiB_018237 [Lonicera macranthoides]